MRITLSFLSLFALSSQALADVCFYPLTRVQNAKGETIAMCGPTDMKHCRWYVDGLGWTEAQQRQFCEDMEKKGWPEPTFAK